MKRIGPIITSCKRQEGVARLRKSIENSDKDLVLGTVELALNVLNGNCKISRCDAERLPKHNGILRRPVDKGIAHGKKRKLIMHRSVFLFPLLAVALSALPSLTRL
jgi:hypothetical protein